MQHFSKAASDFGRSTLCQIRCPKTETSSTGSHSGKRCLQALTFPSFWNFGMPSPQSISASSLLSWAIYTLRMVGIHSVVFQGLMSPLGCLALSHVPTTSTGQGFVTKLPHCPFPDMCVPFSIRTAALPIVVRPSSPSCPPGTHNHPPTSNPKI